MWLSKQNRNQAIIYEPNFKYVYLYFQTNIFPVEDTILYIFIAVMPDVPDGHTAIT